MSGVGIIGGGLLGLGLADKLAARGVQVTLYEAAGTLGGLAGSTQLGGVRVDRFYHAVTTTDRRVLDLAEDLGLRIRWRNLGVGFFVRGEGNIPGLFGVLNSPRTFGGFGAGSTGFTVDPERDLSLAFLSAGLMEDSYHVERMGAVADLVVSSIVK